MDPLWALGAACNILAVIDFAWTLLPEAQDIHKTSSGLSSEAEFMDILIQDVAKLEEGLSSQVPVSKEVTKGVTTIPQAIAQIQSMNIRLHIKRREDLRELQHNLVRAIKDSSGSGQDITTIINSLAGTAGESEPSEDRWSDVSTKLADFRNLEAATRAVSESAETARADQAILDQLYFNGIQARHHTIEAAHAQTFQRAIEELDAGLRLRD
ncbi:hypothetical protein PG988_012389 [Apiospora saccharicola]